MKKHHLRATLLLCFGLLGCNTPEYTQATLKEKISQRLAECWGEVTYPTHLVTLIVEMNIDGTIKSIEVAPKEQHYYKHDPAYQKTANTIISRFKGCQLMDLLSTDRYEDWKQLELTYDPSTTSN